MDRESVHYRNECLLNLLKDRKVFPHMRDLILRGSDEIRSSRWNGVQTLQVFLQYAVKMCICLKPGSLKDTLKPLKDIAYRCCTDKSYNKCQEFLELLFSSAPKLRQIFTIPQTHHVSDTTVKRNKLVQSFIHFLIEMQQVLLDSDVPEKDQLQLCLTDLKFLLAFLGDTPFRCTELEGNNNILTQVEAIVNEAGDFLYSFLFPKHRAGMGLLDSLHSIFFNTQSVDVALSVLLKKLEILKAKIKAFCTTLLNIPAQNTSLASLFIVDSLLDDLNHLISNKADLIVDVKDQVTTLHEELMFSRSLLKDIRVHRPSDKEMKECVMQLSNLAYEAEYTINLFVVGYVPIWYLTIWLTDFVLKNKLIKNALTDIRELVESPTAVSLEPKSILLDVDILVGFNEETKKIISQLAGGPKYLQIISITGMPGLGKTTLAKKLYGASSIVSHFDKRCWCSVSQTYHKKNILIEILSSMSNLDRNTMNNMDDQSLAERVYKSLKGNRYLIIMDDMWNISAWDDFKRYFPDDNNGSRILFTSRVNDVAFEASSNAIIHALPLLPEDECWYLLKQKVFKNDLCPPELQDIGKEIARNCEGLPLAVVVIGSLLANMEKEKCLWQKIASSSSSYIFQNTSKDILELSYEHLPIHLRPCFLYFGALGNSKEVPITKLLSLWIAEGFVRKEEHKTLEDLAEECLVDLINRSLVQISKRRSDSRVKACNLHDLIHDMCLRIAEKENFLKVVKKDFSIYEQHHRLSVIYDTGKTCTKPCGLHIRSLFSYPFQIPPFSLRNLNLTRVLESYRVLEGIEFLVLLRYLAISNLSSLTVPLENLEYLLAEYGRVIPPFIMSMPKLKHVRIAQPIRFSNDCDVSQINNLETLSVVFIVNLKDEEILKCSPNLRKLKCVCKPLLLEDGTYGYPNLNFLTQLESLKMILRSDIKGEYPDISFPNSIKKLTLSEIGLPWEKTSVIGRLPHLEVLKLESDAFKGETWNTNDDEFQKLKFLKLDSLELEEWNTSSDHFPVLERLVSRKCLKLTEIPSDLGGIPTLQTIEVHSCGTTVRDSAMQIKQEQLDYGNEEFKIIISGSDETMQ